MSAEHGPSTWTDPDGGREIVRALVHESRNALQHMQASLSLLRLKAGDPDAVRRLAEEVESGQARLDRCLGAARAWVEPLEFAPRAVEVDDVVRSAWARVAGDAPDAELDLVTGSPPPALLDAALVGTALGALFSNAIEAASDVPARVTVRVSAGRAGEVEIAVVDAGAGFVVNPPERALEPFYTTRAGRDGLGLSVARRILLAHGGSLEIVRPGPGDTELRVCLPAA